MQYLADLAPDKNLAPKYGTMERYRLMEWLNFISSELHKRWSPLFRKPSDEVRKSTNEELAKKFTVLEESLTKSDFLMGKSFTVADAYLFTVLNWAKGTQVELPGFLSAYVERIGKRPAVKLAMQDEGLKTY